MNDAIYLLDYYVHLISASFTFNSYTILFELKMVKKVFGEKTRAEQIKL